MNTPRDQNRIPTLLGTSNTTGLPISVKADPTLHALNVTTHISGVASSRANAVRDDNRVPVLLAVSSVDGKTPVEVWANTNGNLLIQTT